MSALKAVVILSLLAAAAASLVAVVSRAPASVRFDRPGPAATDPALGARFTDEEVARAGAYRGPSYLAFALGIALQLAALVVVARGPLARLIDRFEGVRGGWPVRACVAAVAVTLVLALVALPLGFVRGFMMQRAWGISNQDASAWLLDQLRALLVGAITVVVAAVSFFALVRWQPRAWPLWGWAVFSLLTLLLTFLYPIVIAPLFNRFSPLDDPRLTTDVRRLAERAGIDLDEVLVADASKRSTLENAYVAGLGSSRRLVVYDTLLNAGDERSTLFVVAHELGHQVHDHVVKNVAIASLGLAGGFTILAWLARRPEVWSWGGASGIADVRALPVLMLFALVAGLLILPLENAVSRHFEAQADRVAIDLTHDPDTAVRVFRRLALSNISDLRPPGIAVWTLFTHPPTVERIDAVIERAGPTP